MYVTSSMDASWPIVGVALVIGIIIGAVGVSQPEEIDPNKITVSGSVETITSDTTPVRLDFIKEKSSTILSASLNENHEYSIHLDPGQYRVKLTYAIGGIIFPTSGFCGTYALDADNDSLDLRC